MRTLALAAGTAIALGLSAPLATASPGTHLPTAGTAACDSIPDGHDKNVTKVVYDKTQEMGADDRVLLSAFEAGWVASHMNNLDCGSAFGVFQQRPGDWGTPEQLMDPAYASTAYLERAIPAAADNPGWTAGQVAQDVMNSAYPDRYDEAEGKAKELIAEHSR